jgi:citrate lyase beta subunit
MIILRSLLFIPAISEKMLDKMPLLNPDAFLLDLEDSDFTPIFSPV